MDHGLLYAYREQAMFSLLLKVSKIEKNIYVYVYMYVCIYIQKKFCSVNCGSSLFYPLLYVNYLVSSFRKNAKNGSRNQDTFLKIAVQ